MITLITGGARSGKSGYALRLAEKFQRRAFLATAEAVDEEMERRIADHRRERGTDFQTFEEPCDLGDALAMVQESTEVIVVDCLTVWLGNLMHRATEEAKDPPQDLASLESYPQIEAFFSILDRGLRRELILVSNELGMGVVPVHPMGRAFRDLAGRINQEVAQRAQRVLLMVSGIPMVVKGNDGE